MLVLERASERERERERESVCVCVCAGPCPCCSAAAAAALATSCANSSLPRVTSRTAGNRSVHDPENAAVVGADADLAKLRRLAAPDVAKGQVRQSRVGVPVIVCVCVRVCVCARASACVGGEVYGCMSTWVSVRVGLGWVWGVRRACKGKAARGWAASCARVWVGVRGRPCTHVHAALA